MHSGLSMSNATDLLMNSGLAFPLAYAAFKHQGDVVFMSNRLKSMLGAEDNFVDPYDFVKLSKKPFGSFLNIAVEKLSDNTRGRSEYSSITNVLGEGFVLKLIFEKSIGFYIFIVENISTKNGISFENDIIKIIDVLPLYIWSKDKNLKITYCNKTYADAAETSAAYIIANNIRLFPQAKKTKERVVIGGVRRFFQISEIQVNDRDFQTYMAIDITNQEELQKEYDSYKKQANEILDSLPVPIAIFSKDTTFVFANSAMTNLFHLDNMEAYVTCKFRDFVNYIVDNDLIVTLPDPDTYKKKANELFATVIEPLQISVLSNSNKTMNVMISPNRDGGLIFVMEDVSERISLEREVSSISTIQLEILAHLSEGVFVFGTDNRIKMTNSPFMEIWQSEKVVIGKHIRDFFKNSIEDEDFASELIGLSTQRTKYSDSLVLKSGKVVQYNYIPLPEGLNLVTFLDVTGTLNLQKELDEKNAVISQIEQLKANLISSISYEFKSPLNTISEFMKILLNEYFGGLSDKQLEYCNKIGKTVVKLTDIVETILDLASIDAGQTHVRYEETNLFEFINEIITSFAEQRLHFDSDVENEFAYFDKRTMKRAISKLISRALEITPSECNIAVSMKIFKENFVEFIVEDAKSEIFQDELECIQKMLLSDLNIQSIDKFIDYSIAIANSVFRLHNGKIMADLNGNQGTSIHCLIPKKQFLL